MRDGNHPARFADRVRQSLRTLRALDARWRMHQLALSGAWAVRLLRWRQAVARGRALVRLASRRRARQLLRMAHFALPLAPRGMRAFQRARGVVRPRRDAGARARIIVNPLSGALLVPGALTELQETADWLEAQGLATEVYVTEYPGHATRLAREAAQAHRDIVIAAGGDGTVNDVVQGLAGCATALGVLPLGTVNVWAREVGIPLTMSGAAQVILDGVRRRVDLGRAGARYFLLMAGIGFDAEVARRVEQRQARRVGLKMMDYITTASYLTITQQPARIWMRQEGRRRSLHALMVIIGNTRLHGGAMTFATRAVADDGWLDIVVLGGGGVAYRVGVMLRALLHRPTLGPHVRYARARTVRLESDPPLPVQVDGEVVGKLPMTFSVVPLALTVIVPRKAPSALFVRDPVTP